MKETLKDELTTLLNRHSAENGSDTPDFILAEYMLGCLAAFEKAVVRREKHATAIRELVDEHRALKRHIDKLVAAHGLKGV